ncbi:hypothetical protein HYH02_002102 [Chlamydomonas schloesseri]|uniref:Right handed beta helix domain-containing protein n=1 Tax=Chlamydomonas schloesseri TaxID=2026947 RepID=A0A835WUI7_9CHLO|nr:hypothetical protein HYH02_002102 [Chlamydomonas schloesseri]|eukprot:KAG2453896.1 hypothetical protein HYH02_002102 [Chlamydomonas schloesseri]
MLPQRSSRSATAWRLAAALCAAAVLLAPRGATADTVTLQAGKTLPDWTAGGAPAYYNHTYETSITTQYIDTWNNQNGITYFWGSAADSDFAFSLADANPYNPAEKYRTLLRFHRLSRVVPPGAAVTGAELTLTFINYGGASGNAAVQIEGCFMTKAWAHLNENPYKGTGWRYARYDAPSAASVPWAQPGAWADCSPAAAISFVLPANGAYGYVSQTIPLPPAIVASWIANNGAANYGVLFRATNGSVSLITSQWRKDAPALRRPALSVTYSTDPATPQPTPLSGPPLAITTMPRTWWVDPAGSDEAGSGHPDSPFKTPAKALFEAWPGDKIYMRTGVYPGSLQVTRPRITMQSAPGHWAVVALPRDDPQAAVNVITLRPGADGGVLSNFEITGGFYYGVMFFTSWENYGAMADRVARGAAPSGWTLSNLSAAYPLPTCPHPTPPRAHARAMAAAGSTTRAAAASSEVMKASNNTFANLEVFNTGARWRLGGHGIEAVQAYDITVRDCYFHDIPGAAVHLAGGTARALLERNFVTRTNFGFNLGFATEYEYMDPIHNPALYESINATARNNIIAATNNAGINVWASLGAVVAHNTLWQAAEGAQSAVLVNAYSHDYTPSGPVLTSCSRLTVWGNLLVRSTAARAGPVFQIRAAGLDPNSPLVMGGNLYYDQDGVGPVPFVWGNGAMLEDERAGGLAFVGNATGWAAHCATALGQAATCDLGSLEANPRLDAAFAPLQPCSPALGRAPALLPSAGAAVVADDFHGRSRVAAAAGAGAAGGGAAGGFDAGAVQAGAAGPTKPMPAPVPLALAAAPAPFMGVGPGPAYDKQWPYDFWRTRACKDLVVDAVGGSDWQSWKADSSYGPFKTVGKALELINQCDRILLRAGQTHVGPFAIYRPNVTITTHPADLAAGSGRAVVTCPAATGATPCIRTGEGLYGGAAAVQLTNFNVVMAAGTTGSCIHFNEGAGSGSSAYWAFYLASTGKAAAAPTHSVISDMALTNCGMHGVKLSTFVRKVRLEGLAITNPKGAGIEVRGGGDLVIARKTITGAVDTAVRLGGGARNCLVERNLIKDFGGRGILLGSDNTEVAYMDVDWAAYGSAGGSWHDNINTLVRNNILHGGAGAGIAFYSARDATVVHNTLIGVAATMQAGVLLNVSPKQLGPTWEVGAPNTNITFKNNVVTLGGDASSTLMVESRLLQGSTYNRQLALNAPAGTCPARRLAAASSSASSTSLRGGAAPQGRRMLRAAAAAAAATATISADPTGGIQQQQHYRRRQRQLLSTGLPFAKAMQDATGEQGRNPDGSCPLYPATHAWHQDVSSLPVHPNSQSIKLNIGGTGSHLHADFGGGYGSGANRIYYGIPYVVVDSSKPNGPGLTQINIGPAGYPAESDSSPAGWPIPPTAPVEGAYANCPPASCGGDRHILVVDNATCLLNEAWRAVPPALTGTGAWQADIVARFNVSRERLERPLGWSSADAAGLAILPGLVRYEEIVKGSIDHAIRFTGPNSRAAYAPPASHFAATSTSPDAPWMGMRVRLNSSFDCAPLKRAARIFCVALQKYGAVFADNGSPWYFSGEATASWESSGVLSELYDISSIPSAFMEVLDTGCLCLDADCTVSECGGVPGVDPAGLPVYPAVAAPASANMHFANNVYFKPGSPAAARYIDRAVAPFGAGYSGGLAGWQAAGYESGSTDAADPAIDPAKGYKPAAGSPAVGSVPVLAEACEDYNGAPRGAPGGATDAGAVLA